MQLWQHGGGSEVSFVTSADVNLGELPFGGIEEPILSEVECTLSIVFFSICSCVLETVVARIFINFSCAHSFYQVVGVLQSSVVPLFLS